MSEEVKPHTLQFINTQGVTVVLDDERRNVKISKICSITEKLCSMSIPIEQLVICYLYPESNDALAGLSEGEVRLLRDGVSLEEYIQGVKAGYANEDLSKCHDCSSDIDEKTGFVVDTYKVEDTDKQAVVCSPCYLKTYLPY